MRRGITMVGVAVAALVVFGYAFAAHAPYFSILQNTGMGMSAPREARVLFVGDMLFDRYIRLMMERHGESHIFSCLGDLFANPDLVVGNLEGPITASPSVSAGSEIGSPNNFHFTFPPETAPLLARHGVDVVNLGNNHIGNFGHAGVASTKHYLAESGVDYFGGLREEGLVYRQEVGGVPLSLVSYNEFGGASSKLVAEIIAAEKLAGRVVVVYTHWGEEYVEAPLRVRTAAQLFAQAGASAIIGSHPHVVLSAEYIGETLVYWSLGNFIFDQYWNENVSRGLAVTLTLSPAGVVGVAEQQVELLRDGRTCLLVE